MGYSRWSWETRVRRRGGIDQIGGWGEDDGGIDGERYTGNRRSRQIAKRHFVHKKFHGWPEYLEKVKKPDSKEAVIIVYDDGYSSYYCKRRRRR